MTLIACKYIYMYVTLWHFHIFERGRGSWVCGGGGKLESQIMTVTFFFAYWY